jgi:TolB protein
MVTGSVTLLADGRYDVRLRLWDIVRGQDLGGQSYTVGAADLRLSAHRISDFVYEKLTGEKGIFSTRIAYVTKAAQKYNLWVADSDGEGAQSALTSGEPIISPAWSPNGSQLAYVSFESRKPVIYAHDVASGGGACWPTSAAPTARRPGRRTASSWWRRSAATAARSFTRLA